MSAHGPMSRCRRLGVHTACVERIRNCKKKKKRVNVLIFFVVLFKYGYFSIDYHCHCRGLD